jgi:transcriptional regulator with XRE-family HTH domain
MNEIRRIPAIPEQRESAPGPAAPGPSAPEPAAPEPLWREVLGHRFRRQRLLQGKTLAETAARAGISPQYLSEIERGRKEASSEMIAAVAGALGTALVTLTEEASSDLRRGRLVALREVDRTVDSEVHRRSRQAGAPLSSGRVPSGRVSSGRVELAQSAGTVALALAA